MKSSKRIREQIFQVISNQMMANDPPETKLAFERLKALGYSDLDTKKLIGQCIAIETYRILKYQVPFDLLRFASHLNKLPEEPHNE